MKKVLSVLVGLCMVLSLVAGGVPGAAKAAPPATPMDIGTVTTAFGQESYTVDQETRLAITNTTTYGDMSGFGANILVDAWIAFNPALPADLTLHAKGNDVDLGVHYTVPQGATGFWLSSLVPAGSARPPVRAESGRTEVFEVICDSMPAAFVVDPLTITASAVAATADGFGDGTDQSNWTVLATDSTSVTVNGAAVLELSGVTNPTVSKAGALLGEQPSGKATDNAALDAATEALTPIDITLQNTGNATSEAVRIAPVGTSSHVQLWAKDTNGDWWDINVSGWMPSAGIALPAGYTGTTHVYIISDQAGTYPMTVKVVKASDSTVVTSASGTLTVTDDAAPVLTMGLQATADENTKVLPVTYDNNYWLDVGNPEEATVYRLSFTEGSTLSEPVVTDENGLVPVYLQPTPDQVTALTTYYTDHNPEGQWRTYLLGTLNGTNPMAYIDATDFTAPVLLDAAQYELNQEKEPMIVVGDFPQGTYALTGELTDVDEGRTTTLSVLLSFTTQLSMKTEAVPDGVVGKDYATTLEATGGVGTHTWELANGTLPVGLELDPETGAIAGTPTTAGTFTFTVTATDENEAHVDVELTLSVYKALTVTPQTLPDGVKDAAYPSGAHVANVVGGTESYTYTLKTGDQLPSGLALGSADGLISGTPTATGTFTFTVTVSDSADPAQTADVPCTIHVYESLGITTASLPDGWVGTDYSAALVATGGTGHYTWSVVGGPDGLELDTSTGAITGTPAVAGRFEMNFTVTDDADPANSDEVTLYIQVYETTLSITSTSPLTGGYVNRPYSEPLTAAGGNGTYAWSIASGTLPPRLFLSGEEPVGRTPVAENYTPGEIYGTPTTAGTYTFTVKVVSGDQAVLKEFTITITQTYVLTLEAGANGSVEASPAPVSGNYAAGTVVTLTATPDDGYHVVWPENVTPDLTDPNKATVTMDADKTVTVTFAINTYTLTITEVGEGTVTADPLPTEGKYAYGTVVTLTAAPATGWHFVSWSDNVTLDEEDPLKATVTIEDNTTVTATFAINTYTLTITKVGEGTVTVSPDANEDDTYDYGTVVTLTAAPATGWHFVSWSDNVTVDEDDLLKATVTIEDNTTVTATFAINTYTLTTTIVGNGTVTADPEPTDGTYDYGTEVTLTAVPDEGYYVTWTGATPSDDDPNVATVTITDNTEVTATFENTYTLTTTIVGSGTVTAAPDPNEDGTYDYGTEVTLTAVPDTGWHFVGWSGGLTGTTTSATITMTENTTVTATFAIDTFTVTVSVPNDHGTAVADKTVYDYGDDAVITLTPETGWVLNTIMDNDVDVTSQVVGNAYTIANVTANHTVTVTYKVGTYVLMVNVTGSGTVAVSPNQPTYAYGTVVTLTATPATGYSFTGWSGDLTGTTNPATITMTGDKTVTATFAINTYTISVTATNGSAVADKASYAYGEAAHVTLTPNTGYVLSTVVDNGADVTGQVAGGVYTIASMTANHTIVVTFVPVAVLPGDVDGDGHVTMLDALMAARAAVGITSLTGAAFTAADVNHDGFITMLDVLLIARMAVGIPG